MSAAGRAPLELAVPLGTLGVELDELETHGSSRESMSRSVTSSSAKPKPLAAMLPSASACTGVNVRTSLCVNDSTRLMRPSVPAATPRHRGTLIRPRLTAVAASTEPCRPRSRGDERCGPPASCGQRRCRHQAEP